MRQKLCPVVLAFFLVSLPFGFAEAITIDFETLANGQIVDNEFSPGLTISATNVGGGPNLAVIFDSNLPANDDLSNGNPGDPDLIGPDLDDWALGNIKLLPADEQELGNLLIIEENASESQNTPGFIDRLPDDEGARPAGWLQFDFNTLIYSFGFDIVDVEGPLEYGPATAPTGYFAAFYNGGMPLGTVWFAEFVDSSLSSPFYDPTIVFGNNSANRISPITTASLGIEPFNSVQIHLGGSAGVDNINYTVPEPTTLFLLGSGLFGLAGLRRRSKK